MSSHYILVKTFKENWYPYYSTFNQNLTFIKLFTFFFPFLTGIHAGLKYSAGDLKVNKIILIQ